MVDLKDIEEKLVITNSLLESIDKNFSFDGGIWEILEKMSNSLNNIVKSLGILANKENVKGNKDQNKI